MGDNRNIVAGTGAAGADGTGLAWFAPTGSTAPTDATTALAAAWRNAGMITEDGLSVKLDTSSKKIKAYGSTQVQRTLVNDSSVSFTISMLETNAVSQAVYWGLDLTTISPTVGTGAFSLAYGVYTRRLYAAVFDLIDGTTRMRYYAPQVEVTDRQDIKISNGNEVSYGVTLTAYPNTSGVALQMYDIVPSLG